MFPFVTAAFTAATSALLTYPSAPYEMLITFLAYNQTEEKVWTMSEGMLALD